MKRAIKSPGGFTLLEVVVALAVVSVSLTMIYRAISSSARNTGTTDDYYRALQIAESRMSLLSAQSRTAPFDSGLVGDRFRWETRIQEYLSPLDSSLASGNRNLLETSGVRPYLLSVSVSWGDFGRRKVSLATVRLLEDR
ncbi:prepilin-type N-terminal cleavage/methylation domain-containing protein [Parahaliea maris]|uniref:prepilin-type N-terminal cleavage/methylation domain-containing protein n=1 Tax=Parahaliea maris TaxID=2716870 RepID=UPI0038B26291